MLFALQYLTEWSLEATNLLDQGRKRKNGEDVKTHKLQQISGCAAAAIKLFKGHVLSCKSLKSEMFILHSYSLCWVMNTCRAMQTSVFSVGPKDWHECRGWWIPSLPGVCGNREWGSCLLSEQWKWSISCCPQHSDRPSSSPRALREDISCLSFLSVLRTIPNCIAKYGAVITFIIVY